MFTVKDLEVYKDALKEKKNKAAKTGEKPLKTPPSVAKTSKPPLKLQNEEPIKERKPLSVVHKASNTIKDPHKPPPPIPVGTSKQTNPGLGIKTKEITSKSPSPGLPTEANSHVKASDIKSELPQSPLDTSLPKSSHMTLDDNRFAGVRKLKEPSIPRASNGAFQKTSSFSGVKVATAANVNASLCSECTRAASEGAVCFIGNDGRVSACTTRSAVRLCKNLNCAANNPEYVAAMANAPKKYLISKRHLLKAQFGPKSKSGRSKPPNLHQTGAASIDEWHHSGDAQSPLMGDINPSNGGNANLSLNNFGLECEDGELSPMIDNLSLFDGDMNLLDGHDAFCDGEMGLTNDVMRGTAFVADYAAAKQGIAEHIDVINEQKEFSFHEGEAREIESPKEQVEALAEGNGYNAASPYADTKSSELANSEELADVDSHGSPNLKASETGIATIKDHEDMLQSGDGYQVDAKAQSGDMDSMIGASQVEDEIQNGNVMSTTDSSKLLNDDKTGNKCENNQEQIGGETSTVDANQITNDSISVVITGQPVHNDAKGGDLTPIEISRVGDDGDSASIIDKHVAHNYQSSGTESNEDDGHSGVNGSTKSLLTGHVTDNRCGNNVVMLDGGHAGDDVTLANDALNAIVTSSNRKHIADDDQGDVSTLLNDQHGADDDQCDDLTSPHYTLVADQDDNLPSSHGKHVGDDEENDETAFLQYRQALEDSLIHGLTSPNDGHGADDDESDEDCNEDDETDEIAINMCTAADNSPIDLQKSLDSTEKRTGSEGEDGTVTSGSMRKGSKQRRRRVLNVVEESNPEKVTLRKQQMLERKQAEEWMLNYAIEGVVQKLAPTGEAKVKILVEAFETIISHTDVEGSDIHNGSKEKHTIA